MRLIELIKEFDLLELNYSKQRDSAIWIEKKCIALLVSARLKLVGENSRSLRMNDCWKNGKIYKVNGIARASFCRDRLCPLCSWRQSKHLAEKLGEIITINELEFHSRYIFLTLAVCNVPWSKLSEQIGIIMHSWEKMHKRIKRAAVVTGWVKTFEVTRSKEHGDAHLHLRVLMQVPPGYFDRYSGFCKKDELVRQLRECLQTEYASSISINAVKDTDYEIGRAVVEITKYIAKGYDINGLDNSDFKNYVDAMHQVKCWSTGGRMKISDDDIEAFLHDGEETHPEGICGNCGGKLHRVREVWDEAAGVYRIES
jgi:plasmid rolling circle replication initiator protein Rep